MGKEPGFVFFGTGMQGDEHVAFIGNRDRLGDSGISDLQKAFSARAKPKSLGDYHPMKLGMLDDTLLKLYKMGMLDSIGGKAVKDAREAVARKKSGVTSMARPKHAM